MQGLVVDDVFLRLDGVVADCEFLLKLEGLNPAGSVKLKTAVGLLDAAERDGRLRSGGHVIESSSGNLGVALGMACAERGYTFTLVTDPNALPRSLALIRATGANIAVVEHRDANGGFLGSRIDHIKGRLAVEPDLVWLNQYANPANARVHAARTAKSIFDEFGDLDYLVVGAGTTGTLMGCLDHVADRSPDTKVVAVDTSGSVTFGTPAGPRFVPGLGTSRRPELADPARFDRLHRVVHVDELDAILECRWLARTRGLVAGGSTGSVVAAVRRIGPEFPAGARVVALAPDLGDGYLETVYSDSWVAAKFGVDLSERDFRIPPVRETTTRGRIDV
ncbi:2,3-diaminopropionate biosynthesis protein SbnA [Actinokineospora sp.]|uniref:2,3-diaminopropionate biosynthesis protein SbnA n=1 Tax=Actinokineospora sp. TaxID=1872133 RepID=UPI004037CD7A